MLTFSRFILFFISLLCVPFLNGEEVRLIALEGHLSRDSLQNSKELLDKIESGSQVFLKINSSSGDLRATIDFAQELFALQSKENVKVTAYIYQRALGPAAIFPFLADTLVTTPVMVWGDISHDVEKAIPYNQLQAYVLNLIPPSRVSQQRMLAQGMMTAGYRLINEQGWTLEKGEKEDPPVVINQQQLADLGIPSFIMTDQQFQEKFPKEPASLTISHAIEVSSPNLDSRLAKFIRYHADAPNLIGYLSIEKDRGIDQSTFLYVKYALEHFKKKGCSFIILNLNTPGGEVFASMKIADLLHRIDTEDHIPVVAFIDNWAISAGAMLAYSCRFIGTVKSASMGAAEPVIAGSEGKMESASEKVNSALRTEFANLAAFYGRNPLIAEAMVDKDMTLVLRHGEVVRLEDDQEIRTQGEDPDFIITRKGKLLTLNAEQLVRLAIADFMVEPHSLPPISEEERIKGQWPAEKSLLFQEPFFAKIPQAEIVSYSDWKIDFFAFLSHPFISSILFMGLMIGVYMEMNHPGFGLPGVLALTCLGLILLSSFSVQAVSILEIIILSVGILLLLVEFFVLPGFGIAGVLGIILTVMGLFALLLPHVGPIQLAWNWDDLNLATVAFLEGLAYLSAALVGSVILIALIARFITPRLFKFSPMILREDQEGYIAGLHQKEQPAVGVEGVAWTELKPGGKIMVNDQIYDALSDGPFIERGEKVIILNLQGSSIIVGKKL